MRVAVFIIFVLIFGSGYSQADWSIVSDNNLSYDDQVQVEVLYDTIYTAGHNWTTDIDTNYCEGNNWNETKVQGIIFEKYDTFGVKICEKIFYDSTRLLSTYASHFSGFKIYESKLYFYGTSLQYYTYLIKSNTDFTQDTILYYPPNTGVNFTGSTGLLATESGLYLLAQQKKPNELNDILVIHTDLEGKEVWRKVYGEWDTEEIGYSIQLNDFGQIVIGGERANYYFLSPLSNRWWHEYFLVIDSSGNRIKEWESSIGNNLAGITGLQISQNKLIFGTAIIDVTDVNPKGLAKFECRDTDYELIWEQYISNSWNFHHRIWGATLTPDSTAIVGVGRLDDGGPGFHFKVDAATGAIIYQRALIGCTEEYDAIDMEFFDVACLSSGSTVACGYTVLQTPVAPAYTGWIVKTNPWGIDLMDECTTVSTGVVTQMQHTGVNIKVSPNPASGEVTIHLPEVRQEAYLRLVNLSGQVVQQQIYLSASPVLDLTNLEAGLYIVQVLDRFGNVLAAGKVVKL